MDKSKELMELRAKSLADARAVADKAKAESRSLNAEEQGQYDKLVTAVADCDKQIKEITDARNSEARDAELRALEEAGRSIGRPSHDPGRVVGSVPTAGNGEPQLRAGASKAERRRHEAMRAYRAANPTLSTNEYRTAYARFLATGEVGREHRAQTVGTDTAGGYLVPGEQFIASVIQGLDNALPIRQYARVIPLTAAASLGVPTLDTDPDDPTTVAETDEGSEVSMAFGKRELTPRPKSSLLKVSNTLLRMSAISADALVLERLIYKMGVAQEKDFMTGSGAAEALGLFTASTSGISTSRDVSTGNTDTAITYDGLVNCMMSCTAPYRASADCAWVFHRTAVKNLMLLKDGEGRPIFNLSSAPGNPNTLLGYPMLESEYAPSTFTSGLYVGLFGNLDYYWIAESLAMTVQRLSELYAAENSTGYIGRAELDGMPTHEAAFARVKLA